MVKRKYCFIINVVWLIMDTRKQKIIEHYKSFFEGHEFEILTWNLGPIKKIVPDFEVIRFSPGSKTNLWVYCSIGASTIESKDSVSLEFLVVSPVKSNSLVETIAMVTYYHSNHNLDLGHSLPIGESWLENSKCDHYLISLPYLFGQELEIIPLNGSHVHVVWLLPITETEYKYKMVNGVEALEKKFDDVELKYWIIKRES